MNRRDFIKMGTVAGSSGGLHAAERQVVYGNVQKRWDWTATNLRLVQKGHRIAWMDNDRVIFAGAEIENSQETFGVYIWDFAKRTATKHAKLAWYDDDFFFYEGQIAYRPTEEKMTETHVPWMIGKIGEEKLIWIPREEDMRSPQLWPAMGPGQRFSIDKAARRGYLWCALRPEHGRISVSSGPAGTLLQDRPEDPVRLVSPEGKTRELPILSKELLGVQDFHYAPSLGRYLVLPGHPREWSYGKPLTGREPQVAYLISPLGDVDVHRLRPGRLVTHLDVTRAGFVSVTYSDDPRAAGGWLHTNSGREIKLFEYSLAVLGSSPDGKRLAYAVNTRDPQRFRVNVVEMIAF